MCLLCDDEKAYQAYMEYLDAMERQGKAADPDKAMDAVLDQLEAADKARSKLDEIKDETPEARAKELETEYDRAMAEYDRLDGLAKREEQLAAREATLERGDPRRPTGDDRTVDPAGTDDPVTAETAFRSFLRYGAGSLMPEERKLLQRAQAERRAQAAGTDAVMSMAERAGATITEIPGSHVIMLSQPDAVAEVILTAFEAVSETPSTAAAS